MLITEIFRPMKEKITKAVLISFAGIMFCIVCNHMSKREHAENICLRMSYEQYEYINNLLGGTNDVMAIADYYENHATR